MQVSPTLGVKTLKVFLTDSSLFGHGRLLNLLADIKDLDVAGYAIDGDTAFALIRTIKPDVVILDIDMPGRSGIEVLRRIKQDDPSITVIVLTNASHAQYRKRCTDLGADYFFDKSTEFRRVPEILEQIIHKQSTRHS